jgi:hypothetical protein
LPAYRTIIAATLALAVALVSAILTPASAQVDPIVLRPILTVEELGAIENRLREHYGDSAEPAEVERLERITRGLDVTCPSEPAAFLPMPDWRFELVANPQVNVIALRNGFVLVTDALLLGDLDDSEIGLILGQQMALACGDWMAWAAGPTVAPNLYTLMLKRYALGELAGQLADGKVSQEEFAAEMAALEEMERAYASQLPDPLDRLFARLILEDVAAVPEEFEREAWTLLVGGSNAPGTFQVAFDAAWHKVARLGDGSARRFVMRHGNMWLLLGAATQP